MDHAAHAVKRHYTLSIHATLLRSRRRDRNKYRGSHDSRAGTSAQARRNTSANRCYYKMAAYCQVLHRIGYIVQPQRANEDVAKEEPAADLL